jgi:acyl carrier protein
LDDSVSPEAVIVVLRTVAPGAPRDVDRDTPLLSSGIVDSFSVAELALALSAAFAVEVPLESLGVDNADTPDQLAALINQLR